MISICVDTAAQKLNLSLSLTFPPVPSCLAIQTWIERQILYSERFSDYAVSKRSLPSLLRALAMFESWVRRCAFKHKTCQKNMFQCVAVISQ